MSPFISPNHLFSWASEGTSCKCQHGIVVMAICGCPFRPEQDPSATAGYCRGMAASTSTCAKSLGGRQHQCVTHQCGGAEDTVQHTLQIKTNMAATRVQ
ncbi:hypothetical protein MSG28_015394 [Choristoneura fumiferana]|uniref:Uncharacterized protein n=1 Tax=Choristoneura fumiferana TaxID=7141 RepID=A0ACC0KA99_CHOFU|nr:hypothetical protein MSG28_015394 [Choristoneura fumiferana]